MFKRNDRGQMVVTIEDPDGGIDMTMIDGGVYRFHDQEYLACISEGDLMHGRLALLVSQDDDTPSLSLDRNDGSVCDDTGRNVGSYDELEQIA